MVKILLTSLAALLLVSGAIGVTVVAAKEINMDELLNALQTWSRQLIKERGELQVQEQLQVRLEASQQETSQETPAQTRLRLKNQEQLQLQEQIQNQFRIQLQQNAGTQNSGSYPWNTEAPCPGNSYGPGPEQAIQARDGQGSQQGGRP